MPNGDTIIDAMTFEDKLKELQGDELARFIARQLYQHCEEQKGFSGRIEAVENRDKKFAGAVGGTSALLGAAIIAVLNYFTKQ